MSIVGWTHGSDIENIIKIRTPPHTHRTEQSPQTLRNFWTPNPPNRFWGVKAYVMYDQKQDSEKNCITDSYTRTFYIYIFGAPDIFWVPDKLSQKFGFLPNIKTCQKKISTYRAPGRYIPGSYLPPAEMGNWFISMYISEGWSYLPICSLWRSLTHHSEKCKCVKLKSAHFKTNSTDFLDGIMRKKWGEI